MANQFTKLWYEQYQARGKAQSPKPKRIVPDGPVAKATGKEGNPERVHVRITSFRRKLCDPDNLTPKYFIDFLRYVSLLRDDSPEDITLEVGQVKVKTPAEERTEITITPIETTNTTTERNSHEEK